MEGICPAWVTRNALHFSALRLLCTSSVIQGPIDERFDPCFNECIAKLRGTKFDTRKSERTREASGWCCSASFSSSARLFSSSVFSERDSLANIRPYFSYKAADHLATHCLGDIATRTQKTFAGPAAFPRIPTFPFTVIDWAIFFPLMKRIIPHPRSLRFSRSRLQSSTFVRTASKMPIRVEWLKCASNRKFC